MPAEISIARSSLAIILALMLGQVAGVVSTAPTFRERNVTFNALCIVGATLGMIGYVIALRTMKIKGQPAPLLPRVAASGLLSLGGYLACLVLIVNIYGS